MLAWADLQELQVRASRGAAPTAGDYAASWSATTTSTRFGSRSPPSPSSRPGVPTTTRNCWSAPSSTKNARAASGGSNACRSSIQMTSACASTRRRWTCVKLPRSASMALRRSPTSLTLSLINFWSGICLRSATVVVLKGASGSRPAGRGCCSKVSRLIERQSVRSRYRKPTWRSIWTSKARRTAGSTYGASLSSSAVIALHLSRIQPI